jgi:hypothetical protein
MRGKFVAVSRPHPGMNGNVPGMNSTVIRGSKTGSCGEWRVGRLAGDEIACPAMPDYFAGSIFVTWMAPALSTVPVTVTRCPANFAGVVWSLSV